MKKLNIVFGLEIILFFLIILGILPRYFSFVLAIGLLAYMVFESLENSVILFIRSIPLFLALPLTQSFDNFNTWRILSILIFFKWGIRSIRGYWDIRKYETHSLLLLSLIVISFLSIIPAVDNLLAIKRIIYFINLSLIGIVIYDLAGNEQFSKKLILNISIPVILVSLVGLIQVVSTYFIDIYQFMRLWGENIQCNQFGTQWCQIAVEVGNTWFAYFGEQLSLRVFSLFPDSHSFPVFLLLGVPSLFALAWRKHLPSVSDIRLRKIFRIRSGLSIIFIPIIFLTAILSGTRGIWAASLGVIPLGLIIVYIMRRNMEKIGRRSLVLYFSFFTILFYLLFLVAYPIFVSPQFLVSKGDNLLLQRRIKSILDFGETSNAQRIVIWRASWESIKDNPVLGVGIGNFPIVLGQDLKLAKAGSSAHNMYIQIAAEMGLAALIISIWFLWLTFKSTYIKYIQNMDPILLVYFGAMLIYLPWVLAYVMTDPILFDERVFLIFATLSGLILNKKSAIAD